MDARRYAHPGLQAIYLRLKSFQRFTESWALYERAAHHGLFDSYLCPPSSAASPAAQSPAAQSPPTALAAEAAGGANSDELRSPLRVASLGGGPGYESTNLAFLIFAQALMQFDVGVASAGGLIAVILANIVAFFLIRAIGKNLVA